MLFHNGTECGPQTLWRSLKHKFLYESPTNTCPSLRLALADLYS